MSSIKSAIVAATSLFMILAFQNCGSTMGDAGSGGNSQAERIIPIEKSIAQISIPLPHNWQPGAELKPDGRVIDLQTGIEYPVGPELAAEIREALSAPRLCFYAQPPLPPNTATCMALAMPHAFALTESGEQIPLTISMCHSDNTDLCPTARSDFHTLVAKIRSAITP